MNNQTTAACGLMQEQQQKPNAKSAATSRENPEQADCAAQTGGELAAAPCSAQNGVSEKQNYYQEITSKLECLDSALLKSADLLGQSLKAIFENRPATQANA